MGRLLITGASRGIGAATAVLAAGHGWDVALTFATDGAAADEVAAQVRAAGVRALVQQCDVADEAQVLAVFDRLDREWGGLDALVNNAGVAPGYGPFTQLTAADMDRTWQVNLTGAFVCAREAVRRMSTATGGAGGSIVNLSSKAAVLGGPNEWVHYAASKAGIDALTTGLAKEFAREGIRVNAVRPGLIEHGFGPWAPADRVERMTQAIPMGRSGSADEVAAAIVWLLGDEASYVTGTFLDVSGGR